MMKRPPIEEIPGTVVIGDVIANSDQCVVSVDLIKLYLTGVVARLKYEFRDTVISRRHYPGIQAKPGIDEGVHGPKIGFRYTEETVNAPVVTPVGALGSEPVWLVDYWISPLSNSGATLAISWPECGLLHHEWVLSPTVLAEGVRRAEELRAISDTSDADAGLMELGDITARLADIGAAIEFPPNGLPKHPQVHIQSDQTDIRVEKISESDVPSIAGVLEDGYLVDVRGSLDAQVIVLGSSAETAAVIRAFSAWLRTDTSQGKIS